MNWGLLAVGVGAVLSLVVVTMFYMAEVWRPVPPPDQGPAVAAGLLEIAGLLREVLSQPVQGRVLPAPWMDLQLWDEHETTLLGVSKVRASHRRAVVQALVNDGTVSVFVASHYVKSANQWVYRRVGTEPQG